METDFTKNRSSEYFALNDQIEQELRALDDNISVLPEGELDGKTYDRYIGHFNYVKGLLDKASVLVCSLVFSQEDPELYRLLEARRNIDLGQRYYHLLRSDFCRSHPKELELTEEEREFERVREAREELLIEEEEPADVFAKEVEPAEDELLRLEEEEAMRAAEAETEEKSSRNSASRGRQARLAREGKEAELWEAKQHQVRIEEAARLTRGAMAVSPEAPIAEADLAAERMRQIDDQNRLAREAEERIRRERESLSALREREERAAKYESFGNSHIDFSHGRSNAAPGGNAVAETRESPVGGREAARPFRDSEPDPNRPFPTGGTVDEQAPSPQIVESGGAAVTPAEREHRIHTYGPTATEATIRDAEMCEREARAREAAQRERALEESRSAMQHTSERISRSEHYESFGSNHIDFSHGRSGAGPVGNPTVDSRESQNSGLEHSRPFQGAKSYPPPPPPGREYSAPHPPSFESDVKPEMPAPEREAREQFIAEQLARRESSEGSESFALHHSDSSPIQSDGAPVENRTSEMREREKREREVSPDSSRGFDLYPNRPISDAERGDEHTTRPIFKDPYGEMPAEEREIRERHRAEQIARSQSEKSGGSSHIDSSHNQSDAVIYGNPSVNSRDAQKSNLEHTRPFQGGKPSPYRPAPGRDNSVDVPTSSIASGVTTEMPASAQEAREQSMFDLPSKEESAWGFGYLDSGSSQNQSNGTPDQNRTKEMPDSVIDTRVESQLSSGIVPRDSNRPSPDTGRGAESSSPDLGDLHAEMPAADFEAQERYMAERRAHSQRDKYNPSILAGFSSDQSAPPAVENRSGDKREGIHNVRDGHFRSKPMEADSNRPSPVREQEGEPVSPQGGYSSGEQSGTQWDQRESITSEEIPLFGERERFAHHYSDVSYNQNITGPVENVEPEHRETKKRAREVPSDSQTTPERVSSNTIPGVEHRSSPIEGGGNGEISMVDRETEGRNRAERLSRSKKEKNPGSSHKEFSFYQESPGSNPDPAGDKREALRSDRKTVDSSKAGKTHPTKQSQDKGLENEPFSPVNPSIFTAEMGAEREARERGKADQITRSQKEKAYSSSRPSYSHNQGDEPQESRESATGNRVTTHYFKGDTHNPNRQTLGIDSVVVQMPLIGNNTGAASTTDGPKGRVRHKDEPTSRLKRAKDSGSSRRDFSEKQPKEARYQSGERPAAQSYSPGEKAGSPPIAGASDFSPKQHISPAFKDRPVFDNLAIYSTLKSGIIAAGDTPVQISRAYAYLMERNLELAREAFSEVRGTSAAKQAAHIFAQQRQAYKRFQSKMRSGNLVYDHTDIPAPSKPTPNTKQGRTACDYTPDGIRGFGVDSGRLGSSSFTNEKNIRREQMRYTSATPLRVTPAYDKAIRERLSQATAAINAVVKDGKTLKISRDAETEFLLASNAFRGYERAKKDGCILITEEAGAKQTPDFDYWQDRHFYNVRYRSEKGSKKSSGTSAAGRSANPNETPRRGTEEKSSSIFQKGGILRRARVAYDYLKYATAGAGSTMLYGYREISYRTFNLVDRSDDSGTIHLSRQSWRYTVAVLGVGNAVLHSRITNSAALGRTVTRAEAARFGALSGMKAKELHQRSTSLRERINVLEDRIIGLKGKDSLTSAESASLKELQLEWKRRRGQLSEIKDYQSFLQDSHERVSVHKSLEESLPPLTTKTQLRRELRRLSVSERGLIKGFWGREGERIKADIGKIQKKLDGLEQQIRTLEVKRAAGKAAGFTGADRQALLKLKDKRNVLERKLKGLSLQEQALKADARLSLKGLPKQKALLEAKAKGWKAQIRALELKGKHLPPAERHKLAALREKVALTSFRLKNLNRLSQEAATIRSRRSELNLLHKRLEKNRFAYRRLGYSLFELLSKPVREGSEEGAQGILTLTNAASNRHIHRVVKLTLKGAKKTAVAGRMLVRTTARAGAVVAKTAGLTETTAGKTVAKAASKVKTQVNRVSRGASKVKTAAKDVKAGLGAPVRAASGLRLRVMSRFYDTKVGAAAAKVGGVIGKIGDGARAVFSVAKGTAVKLLLAFGIFFLLVAAIGGSGSFLGGSAGSVILSPDESNGKIDLSSYVAVIREEQQKFDNQLSALQEKRDYDSVSIDYATDTMNNTKEMLSMMAVRMGQDLDMDKNPDVENYLISLFHDSHFYTTSEHKTYCSGCVTKTRLVTEKVINEETGEEETVTRVEEYKICPGHWHLKITISILGFDEIFTADSMGNAGATASRGKLIGRFYITYYQDTVEDQEQWVGQTATGVPPKPNHTIAVDPSVIPLGSHVIIRGKEYVAEDVGGAIKGYHIDMFLGPGPLPENLHNVPVYYASYEGEGVQESGDWNGWTEENIAWCKAIYSPNWAELYEGITTDTGSVIENGDLIVEGNYVWPVTTTTTSSGFGWRTDPITGARSFHKGTDIPIPTGTPIHAAADGTVVIAQYSSSAGNYIKLDHANNVSTRYLHCSQLLVRPGQHVTAGDIIAYSGNTGWSTGPHLHFEFLVNGQAVNPRTQYGLN